MAPMGSDKATLLFHAKPLWQIHLELLQKLELAEIWRSRRRKNAGLCLLYHRKKDYFCMRMN
jgi:molybdopterin-guanine dinucleotide biosynthesis protein A